ncbi:hypothetical protein KBC54_00890 [Patescibacteria group bacterium]|nr:hypothetical protein [Patescibacteria group bacterium]
MKRDYLKVIALLSLGLCFPAVAFGETWKGAPAFSPPQGNTAGVIWNTAGGGQQTGAEINIDGGATVGSTLTVTGVGTIVNDAILKSDVNLTSGKAFKINQQGLATFYMGNWFGGNASSLIINHKGDLMVDRVPPNYVGPGNEGRVQARKFCFYPGAEADCITSWPTGGGLFVNKTGDSMTGPLSLTVGPAFTAVMADGGTIGGRFAGTSTGIQGFSNAAGGYGGAFTGGVRGVQAQGTTYGLFAQTANVGSGTAVYGFNGATGGDFDGLSYGVKGNGGTAGGYFTDKTNTTYTQLATPSYGLFTNNTIYTSGSIHAPNTVLGACVWTGYINDGLAPICPASNPFMNGMQRTGTATRLYCCKL